VVKDHLLNIIILIQNIISKMFRRKSWLDRIDENLNEYELVREGW